MDAKIVELTEQAAQKEDKTVPSLEKEEQKDTKPQVKIAEKDKNVDTPTHKEEKVVEKVEPKLKPVDSRPPKKLIEKITPTEPVIEHEKNEEIQKS